MEEREATPSFTDDLRFRGSTCGRGANVIRVEQLLPVVMLLDSMSLSGTVRCAEREVADEGVDDKGSALMNSISFVVDADEFDEEDEMGRLDTRIGEMLAMSLLVVRDGKND